MRHIRIAALLAAFGMTFGATALADSTTGVDKDKIKIGIMATFKGDKVVVSRRGSNYRMPLQLPLSGIAQGLPSAGNRWWAPSQAASSRWSPSDVP